MLIDYKIPAITRADGITVCTVRYYVGDITTVNEKDVHTGDMKGVTRYRRSMFLKEDKHVLDGELSDKEIQAFLNQLLADEAITRSVSVVDEQKITPSK